MNPVKSGSVATSPDRPAHIMTDEFDIARVLMRQRQSREHEYVTCHTLCLTIVHADVLISPVLLPKAKE